MVDDKRGTERLVWNSFAGCAPTVLYHEWHPANPIQQCIAQYSDPLHLWLLIPAKINGRTKRHGPFFKSEQFRPETRSRHFHASRTPTGLVWAGQPGSPPRAAKEGRHGSHESAVRVLGA